MITDPFDKVILDLAHAMSKAEGWGPPNNFPTRVNNPLDLEIGDQGWGTQAGKTVFPDPATGWKFGYREVHTVLSDKSHYIRLTYTFLKFAQIYTGGDNPEAWADIVTKELGLVPSDTLQKYLDVHKENPANAPTPDASAV